MTGDLPGAAVPGSSVAGSAVPAAPAPAGSTPGTPPGLTPPGVVPPSPATVRAASWAVMAVFALSGANFATWAARLPAVRDALGLDPAEMGLLLLVGALGSLVSLPLSGLIVMRLGAARTVLGFAVGNAVGYLVVAIGAGLGSVPLVAAGLLLVGVGAGVWDAAMNLEGAVVEQHLGRSIMPTYHAGFSLGTAVAAGLAAVLVIAHVPVGVHLVGVVALSATAVAIAVRRFLPAGLHADSHSRADHDATVSTRRSAFGPWLEGRTLLIGLVVLSAALAEGSANDWVSLAVVDGFEVSHAIGAVAFGMFVTSMTVMRLLGTRLLDRHGRVWMLRLCSGLALVGLAVFGLSPWLWLSLLGVLVWGAGAALGFPVGMSAASDDPLRAAARVSVVSTIGYSAFLAGPPLLGLLADHVGYRNALLAVMVPVILGLLAIPAAAPLRREAAGPQVSEPAAPPTLER